MIPTTKFKPAKGTGFYVCAIGDNELSTAIVFTMDMKDTIRLRKVVYENDMSVASMYLDAYYYINEDRTSAPEMSNDYTLQLIYEIERVELSDEWFIADHARLEVYEDRWVIAVTTNGDKYVNINVNFE